jgi:hypothetical protein
MDEWSPREFGRLEQRVANLEERDKVHTENGTDYRKWKNTIIGMVLVTAKIVLLAAWYINKHYP